MDDSHKHGCIIIDKPRGITSFDVVREVRKLGKTRKVGHTGTLDPEATGVLALALGRCTKLSKYLTLDEKVYAFEAKFGEATETGDVEGEVIREASIEGVTETSLEANLDAFRGAIEQVPPKFSAIKVDGTRAYELARAGEEFELDARTVQVDEFELLSWEAPVATFRVRCGPGTYIRSLVRDLGEALGSAAHALSIRRLRVGPFGIEEAVRLEELSVDSFWDRIVSPLEMVKSLGTLEVRDEELEDIRHGRPLYRQGTWTKGEPVALHEPGGRLVAVAECTSDEGEKLQIWPRRVMI